MSRFIVTPTGEIIGHSTWEWDPLYIPVVGLFVGGVLHETAVCRHLPGEITVPGLSLQSRVKRRLLRELGRPVAPVIVAPDLKGPNAPVWFRMLAPRALADRLTQGDPQIRLERLEDAEPIRPVVSPPEPTTQGGPVAPVEALLNAPAATSAARLDGFSDFLTAPPRFQLEASFVEYLRRMPEETAREAYLPQLETGAISVLDLRGFILSSDEFKNRRTRLGSRVGSGMTSPLWRRFAASPTLNEQHRPLPLAAPDGFEDVGTAALSADVGERVLGRTPTPSERARFDLLIEQHGAREGVREITRWGARAGRFFTVE